MPDYPNLEPSHHVRTDDQNNLEVWCPFEVTVGGPVTLHERPVTHTATWHKAAEAVEVECPACVTFNGQPQYVGSPDCQDDE